MSHYKFNCNVLSTMIPSFQRALNANIPSIESIAKDSPYFSFYIKSTLPDIVPKTAEFEKTWDFLNNLKAPEESPFWPKKASWDSINNLKGLDVKEAEKNWGILELNDGRTVEMVGVNEKEEKDLLKRVSAEGDWGVLLVEDEPYEHFNWEEVKGKRLELVEGIKKEVLETPEEIEAYIHRYLEDNYLYVADTTTNSIYFQFRPHTLRLQTAATASLRFSLSPKVSKPRVYFGDLTTEENATYFRKSKSLGQLKIIFKMVNWFNLIERLSVGVKYNKIGCTVCNRSLRSNNFYPKDFFEYFAGSDEVRIDQKHANLSRIVKRMIQENPQEKKFIVVFSENYLGEIAQMISSAVIHGSTNDLPSLRMRRTEVEKTAFDEKSTYVSEDDLEMRAICDIIHNTASEEPIENYFSEGDYEKYPVFRYLRHLEHYASKFSFEALGGDPDFLGQNSNSNMCQAYDIFFGETGNPKAEEEAYYWPKEIRLKMEQIRKSLDYKAKMAESKVKLRKTHISRFGRK
jgi:hypothetical protein